MSDQLGWVPQACTLPTPEQPLRVAEFDDLFATALRTLDRREPTYLRLAFDVSAEQTAGDLTEREAACCSFFTFTLTRCADQLIVDVEVPTGHVDVLDALARRAQTSRRAGV